MDAVTSLNQHFSRPNTLELITPAEGEYSSEALRVLGHIRRGLAWLASDVNAEPTVLQAAISGDLADGLFDGRNDDATSGPSWLEVETTRHQLAEAIWHTALDDVDEASWLLEPGGLLEDISTDAGPLYPIETSATPFQPPAMMIQWLPPLVPEGSWWHAEMVVFAFEVISALPYDVVVESPPNTIATTQPDGTFTVAIDPMALNDGPAELVVRATSVSETITRKASFNIDHTPPVIVPIVWPAAGQVFEVPQVSITLEASDTGAGLQGFDLFLDGQQVTGGLDGSLNIDLNLDDGSHTLVVQTEDGAGLTSVQSVQIIVDTTPPTFTWVAPVESEYFGNKTIVFQGQATDPVHPVQYVQLTFPPFEPEQVEVDASGVMQYTRTFFGNGFFTATAVAVDAIGQVSEPVDVSFGIDMTAPTCIAKSTDHLWVGKNEMPLKVKCLDTESGTSTVTVMHESVGEVELTYDPVSESHTGSVIFPGLEPKHGEQITLAFIGTDFAGNQGQTQVTPTVDTVPPVVEPTLFQPFIMDAMTGSAYGKVVDDLSGAASVTVTSSLESKVSDISSILSGQFVVFLAIAAPSDDISMVGSDKAGNLSETVTLVQTVDTEPPVFQITPPVYGSSDVHILPPGTETYTFTGTVYDEISGVDDLLMFCSIGTVLDSLVVSPPNENGVATWSVQLDLTGPTPSQYAATCTFKPVDVVGNQGEATTISVYVDGTPPILTIDPVPFVSWYAPGTPYLLSGTANDFFGVGVEKVIIDLDGALTDVFPTADSWQLPIALPTMHGTSTASVTATDLFGNTSVAKTVTMNIDAEPPAITVFNSFTLGSIEVDGVMWTDKDTTSAYCNGTDAQSFSVTTCINGNCNASGGSHSVVLPLGEGENLLECVVTDAQGNQTAQQIVMMGDTTPPSLSTDFTEGNWQAAGPVTITGTTNDAGVGLASLHVKYPGLMESIPVEPGGTFTWTGSIDTTTTITLEATDLFGAQAVTSFTVLVDTTPPELMQVESSYLRETDVQVEWDGDAAMYTGGTSYSMPSQCVLGVCNIYKFPTRARFTQPTDIQNNNLPHWKFSVTDEESVFVGLEYRFVGSQGLMTDWQVADDAADGLLDSIYTVVWAIDSFSESPETFVLSTENGPIALEVRATDEHGLQSESSIALSNQLCSPPLRVESMPLVTDGTEMQVLSLQDGTLVGESSFTDRRLLNVMVTNPWSIPIKYRPLPGWYQRFITGNRQWAVPAFGWSGGCTAGSSCSQGLCVLLWPDSDYECEAPPQMTPTTSEYTIPVQFEISVTDNAGVVTTTEEGGELWRLIPPGGTHVFDLNGNTFCDLDYVDDFEMVVSGGAVETRQFTVYDPQVGCNKEWSLPDAAATCALASGCSIPYWNPFVVQGVSFTLWTDNPTVLLYTKLGLGDSSEYYD
ncbi:MAG: hypothetical protein VX223_04650, partial [Myxococcota bacterium]|nr:hypothetical protein [Myxococcota bacterium]